MGLSLHNLGTTFASGWKVLIFPSLSFRIISLFAYLRMWMTPPMLYASIAFLIVFVKFRAGFKKDIEKKKLESS